MYPILKRSVPMCACGCGSCGKPSPRQNGTELTVISGEDPRSLRANDGSAPPNSKKSSGAPFVLGFIAVVSAIVGYATFSDSNQKTK